MKYFIIKYDLYNVITAKVIKAENIKELKEIFLFSFIGRIIWFNSNCDSKVVEICKEKSLKKMLDYLENNYNFENNSDGLFFDKTETLNGIKNFMAGKVKTKNIINLLASSFDCFYNNIKPLIRYYDDGVELYEQIKKYTNVASFNSGSNSIVCYDYENDSFYTYDECELLYNTLFSIGYNEHEIECLFACLYKNGICERNFINKMFDPEHLLELLVTN